MHLWIILLLAYGCLASPSFILTGPKKFQKGGQETLCLTLHNVTKSGSLTFDLNLSEKVKRKYEFPIGPDCYTIDIPDVTSDRQGTLVFAATFKDGRSLNGTQKIELQDRFPVTLIQTDKAWYKPGQLVRFRVLLLDYHLKPHLGDLSHVQVESPGGIIVEQWKNVSMKKGIAQLELQLSPEPVQGTWKISAKLGHVAAAQEFSVKEYELPRFEVELKAPSKISVGNPIVEIETCARYTYGHLVQMNYTLHVIVGSKRRNVWKKTWGDLKTGSLSAADLGSNTTITLTGKGLGCSTAVTDFSGLTGNRTYDIVGIIAYVTEDGTGVTLNATKEIDVGTTTFDFELIHEDSFNYGIPFFGKVKLRTDSKESVANKTVTLGISSQCVDGKIRDTSHFKTDTSGVISFSFIPTRRSCTEYKISTELNPSSTADSKIRQVYSTSGNAIQIGDVQTGKDCEGVMQIPLFFTGDKGDEFSLHWQVISRGDIMRHHHEYISFDKASKANVTLSNDLLGRSAHPAFVKEILGRLRIHHFSLNFTSTNGPVVSIMAYAVRKDGEVLTATKDIELKSCFANKVEMNWSNQKRKPGEKVSLTVSGHKGSYCGTSVVDKSVLLLQPEKQLQERNIFDKLSSFLRRSKNGERELSPDREYCRRKESEKERSDGLVIFYSEHKDPIAAFDDAGLFVISNLEIESRPCKSFRRIISSKWRVASHHPSDWEDRRSSPKVTTQSEYAAEEVLTSGLQRRTYFPETWLWEGIVLDDEGKHQQIVDSPHTITTWVGRALCVSPEAGFGMSPKSELEVFQSFFVELNLPYSVKRGEVLTLKIATFNYASSDLPIVVRMPASPEYEIVSGNTGSSKCVQSQAKAVHIFKIKPKVLGNVNVTVDAMIDELHDAECGPEVIPSAKDSVVKPLLVLPEGIPVEKTFSALLCPKDFVEDKAITWEVDLPRNVIEGSARGWLTIAGDLMSPALNGLSNLVRLPTGCGEQNMVIFTPIVYVMQYLEATRQADTELSAKAIGYLKTGYQQELKYRHDDGSYSAFGKKDESGSLWLTAFVIRSFAGANKFISIDQNDFNTSSKWILQHQKDDGCFNPVGKLFQNSLKGGMMNDTSSIGLTAYVLAALAEAKIPSIKERLRNAIQCLKEQTIRTDYVSSLVAYALAKAGDKGTAALRMELLLKKAKKETGLLWWEEGGNKALAVEMTAYNVMTLLILGEASKDKKYKAYAAFAVKWISKQRNGNGGFYSTQDTVIALQAMAVYASSISHKNVDMMVRFGATNLEETIQVVEDNKLVQKRIDLPVVPTTVKIDAVGQGCAVTQAVLRYNIQLEKEKESFSVNTSISSELNLSGCVKYLDDNLSNMVVVDIELFSGHVPNKGSVDNLKNDSKNGVKRVDVSDGHVYLYYDELDANEKCFSFLLDREFEVSDLKDTNVVAYDYYATHKRGKSKITPHMKL